MLGKKIVFTGTLTIKRAEATKKAVTAGAIVTGSVSKSTDIIVAGPDAVTTTKVLTAQALGTKIWSQADFAKAVAKAVAKPADGAAKAKAKAAARCLGRIAKKVAAKPLSEKEKHTFADFAKTRNWDKVMSLIEKNPGYVNVQPAGRWSALHQAAEAGNEKVVKFLLANGADVSVRTKDGQTPKDVAKGKTKDLLTKASKRKAGSEAGTGPKKGGYSQVLHLHEALSAMDLSEEMGAWFAGDDEKICKEGVQHKTFRSAPASAGKVAAKLHKALDDATLPAGESDTVGKVIIISHAGDDPKEACFNALALLEEVDSEHETVNLKEAATIKEDIDFGQCEKFCFHDEEEDDEEEDENDDAEKIKKATKVMADELTDHFEFNFTDEIVTAPVVYGGWVEACNCIVGVLSSRVWT